MSEKLSYTPEEAMENLNPDKFRVIQIDFYEDRTDEYVIGDNLTKKEASQLDSGAIDAPCDMCLSSTTRVEKI